MAIKGLVDNQAYVLGDYQAPTGYYSPARSVGDYVIDDFVITDYLLESQDLVSTFTIQAQGEINAIRATFNVTFTLEAQAQDLDLASGTLTTAFGLDVLPTRILAGQGSYTVQAQQQTNATASFTGTTPTLANDITHTANANYQLASSGAIDITGFYTQAQVAGELFFGEPPDVTWDSFAESEFIDRTWDEWYGDAWDQGGVFFSQAITLKALGGYRAQASATLRPEFQQQQNITIIVSQEITGRVTQSAQGNFTAAGTGSYDSVFEQADVFFDRFRGVAIDGTPLDLPVISSVGGNANVLFDLAYGQVHTAPFTHSTNANVLFDLGYGQRNDILFTHSTNGNVLYDPTLGLEAFNTQLSAGRLITIADPWNILVVPRETRTLVTPEDSRVIEVSGETRLNTIIAEQRGLIVPQETRSYRIFKPLFTNRSSIPKVRSDL